MSSFLQSRRSAAGFLLLAALLVGVAGWVVSRSGPARVEVDVAPVTRRATFRSTASASGEIVATRYADIGSSAMGKIVSLPVAEGDRVRAGQLLARIDPVQAQSEASGAAAQLGALEAEQAAAAEQIRAAASDVSAAEARARDADQQFARARELRDQGLVPLSEFDTARAAADAASAQVSAARAAVERARQALEASARRVAQARAQVVRTSDIVAKTSILSPIDGTVTRLRVREGEMVVVGIQNQPGTTLMTISDLSAIDAEVKAAEADVLRISHGQTATISLEALPGRRFTGKVVEIGASALPITATAAAAREFRVVVRLDTPDPLLRPGLTCDADIVVSERRNVMAVPLQSVVLRRDGEGGDQSGVFVVVDGKARFTPVTPGVIGGLDIEVDGVDERAAVVAGPYQVLRELTDGMLVRSSPQAR
jgi:HlyD family secretion protein